MPSADSRSQDFATFLTRSGLKSTHQRARIVEAFFAAGQHISAEELYQRLRVETPSLGLVTVYRTLKLLRQAGLAVERQFGDTCARFDPNSSSGAHHHLICTRCGKIQEFRDDSLLRIRRTVARRLGFAVREHNLELYGLCRDCAPLPLRTDRAAPRRPASRSVRG
jgi:Fur family transcriptional regulator, ferric uptake regulator